MKKNRCVPFYSGTPEERRKKNERLCVRYIFGWAAAIVAIGSIFNSIPADLFQNPVFDTLANTTPGIKRWAYSTTFPQAVAAVWIFATYMGPIALIHLIVAAQPYDPKYIPFKNKVKLFFLLSALLPFVYVISEMAIHGSFLARPFVLSPAEGMLGSARSRYMDRTFSGAMLHSFMGTSVFVGMYYCIFNPLLNRIKRKFLEN